MYLNDLNIALFYFKNPKKKFQKNKIIKIKWKLSSLVYCFWVRIFFLIFDHVDYLIHILFKMKVSW